MEIFYVTYLLSSNGPHFFPDLEINKDTNFFELVNSLLNDMIEMGSFMERISDECPSYSVRFYLSSEIVSLINNY